MDPARPPTSELHGALVGILVAGVAAWLAMTGSIARWAWDGQLLAGPMDTRGAMFTSALLAGVAAGVIAGLLGIAKGRRIRLSLLAGLAAGEGAALCVSAVFVGYAWLSGGSIAAALLPLTVGGALVVAAAATGAVILLVPRRA